jgi:hypothetical protein
MFRLPRRQLPSLPLRPSLAAALRRAGSKALRGFRPTLEALEDRTLPAVVPGINWAAVAFDPHSGQVAIRGAGADNTAQEALSPAGFLEFTLAGQRYSSDPASACFDPLLAGASAGTITGIRFDGGGGQDTLILDSLKLPGDLAVSAPGATVVTEDVAGAGLLTIQASDISVRGILQAGALTLTASGWVTVEGQGVVVAAQGHAGGRIEVVADKFVNSGRLSADGLVGGQIHVSARNVLDAGPLTADGEAGGGGVVQLAFTGSYVATAGAKLSASGGAAGHGGELIIDGGTTGRLYSSSRHAATGSIGGSVDLFGREVVLVGAQMDASGEFGGGSVRIGGDFQGANAAVNRAQSVTATAATAIRANALGWGDGGRVVVWSDQDTQFDGSASARGGSAGGSGGFIELSGEGSLTYGGSADASAPAGKAGTLLLDPKNLIIDASVGVFPQCDLVDPHPTAGGRFGTQLVVLNNGNVVVANPNDDFGGSSAGAVYVFDGLSGTLISSLVGSHPSDKVGDTDSGGVPSVTALSNGDFVVASPLWNSQRGAVTWGNGMTGISGSISDTNSLVGTNPNDRVATADQGNFPVSAVTLLTNGNFVVRSSFWNGRRGAVTWGNASTGISGPVSDANSLVGTHALDQIGISVVTPLSNGNYVVASPFWNSNRGAVTWGDGTTGVSGPVSNTNSLVGNPNDVVGRRGITVLSNGNYVVSSPDWKGLHGAVTWADGTRGLRGTISTANSLVGSSAGDVVGNDTVTALSNGNYVVSSPAWNGQRGAATWGDGTMGVSGTISAANSLVGSNAGDLVGNYGAIALSNGNYAVDSAFWDNRRGAVTWTNGSNGVSGTISAANSLVGGDPNDSVGNGGITLLSNGNFVVGSPFWNGQRGASTWVNGTTGISGTISTANSLVGSNASDLVGNYYEVIELSNGNYLVSSLNWNNNRGALTWADGTTGVSGTISHINSLVGSNPGDQIGGVTLLSNGNYVTSSKHWNGQRGEVTWGNASIRLTGTVSVANSLVGSTSGDQVGSDLTTLSNGNYVVASLAWSGQRGAATWGSGTMGVVGTVSAANSLVGTSSGDLVANGGVKALSNGNYVVESAYFNGYRGAVTWGDGTTGRTLDGQNVITMQNSLLGRADNAGLQPVVADPIDQSFLAPFVTEAGGRVAVGLDDPHQLSYALGQANTVTLTPDFLTRILNTGTAVVLQANNDITVNSAITVSAGGNGGALTLQAGRSILLNAGITTDNGALTLIANDTLASGVVDGQRDPGQALIRMASGTTLDTGSEACAVQLRDGAGRTNTDSGAVTLHTIMAGSVSINNNGPSAGSDVVLGPVTTIGAQSYASINGITQVTGNLAATNSPITFNNAVALSAGITISAGSDIVTFAGGTVAPDPGLLTIGGGFALAPSSTFTATLNGTDSNSYSQVTASGAVDLGGSTLSLALGFTPQVGDSFTLLTSSAGPNIGTFAGLDEGATFTQDGFTFQITYHGGPNGNSVVLTRVS